MLTIRLVRLSQPLVATLWLTLALLLPTGCGSPSPYATPDFDPPLTAAERRQALEEIRILAAGDMVPGGRASAPASLSVDGRQVWSGNFHDSAPHPSPIFVHLPEPMTEGEIPTLVLTVAGRTFEAQPVDAKPGIIEIHCRGYDMGVRVWRTSGRHLYE